MQRIKKETNSRIKLNSKKKKKTWEFTSKLVKYHQVLIVAVSCKSTRLKEAAAQGCCDLLVLKIPTLTLQSCPFESAHNQIFLPSSYPSCVESVLLCCCVVCVCACVCDCVAHRWCSVHPSSPGGSHTCHPGRLRGRCSVGDSPSARILDLSSLPRTDTHHWCTIRGDRSPPRTPLSGWGGRQEGEKNTQTCRFCSVKSTARVYFGILCRCIWQCRKMLQWLLQSVDSFGRSGPRSLNVNRMLFFFIPEFPKKLSSGKIQTNKVMLDYSRWD